MAFPHIESISTQRDDGKIRFSSLTGSAREAHIFFYPTAFVTKKNGGVRFFSKPTIIAKIGFANRIG